MNKVVLLTCIAVVLYATQNVLMDMKFAKYSTVSILLIAYVVMLPLALMRIGFMRLVGEQLIFPAGSVLVFAFLTGLIWFVADYCYVSAYTIGGDLLTISTIIAMFPVTASIIKFFATGIVPNRYQIAGYILAVGAIYLVSKGTTIS